MTLAILTENLPLLLADFPEIELVYLFGSQVTGQTGPMSDYDIAVLSGSPGEEITLQAQFQHALVKLLNTDKIDVVLLNRAQIELAYHIIASGKLLYQKDNYTRIEFEARVLGLYGDYLPILRSFRDQTLQGDAHGKRVQRYREALGRTRRALGPARTFSKPKTH